MQVMFEFFGRGRRVCIHSFGGGFAIVEHPVPPNPARSLTFQGSLGLTTHSRMLLFRTRSQRASQRSLDTTTITTYDSSGSGENGLHKFYKRAWENLRYDGKAFPFERPHSRQETLDHPGIRANGRGTIEGFREASEITVNDVAALYARPDKSRSHSQEHLREDSPSSDKKAIREWYSQQLGHHSRRGAF